MMTLPLERAAHDRERQERRDRRFATRWQRLVADGHHKEARAELARRRTETLEALRAARDGRP